MVSNTIKTSVQDLVEALARVSRDFADDPEYQGLRAEFPADWPM